MAKRDPHLLTVPGPKVSDLAWLGTKDYDSDSGKGAIGVEFAGTAVSSSGQSGPIEPKAGDYARGMVARNEEMQWQEGYYRGYFRLAVTPEKATAQFYGTLSSGCAGWLTMEANTVRRISLCRDAKLLGDSPRQLHRQGRGESSRQAHRGWKGGVWGSEI